MFQFSAFASPNLCIQFGMTALVALPGFPIQKSSGHSSFDNSPKLIAVYYVFHRLSAPRHPPCALYSLIIHPTPSKPEPHKAGISSDCSNLSILRHLMLRSSSITHDYQLRDVPWNVCTKNHTFMIRSPIISLYRFLLFNFQGFDALMTGIRRRSMERLYLRRSGSHPAFEMSSIPSARRAYTRHAVKCQILFSFFFTRCAQAVAKCR